MLNFKLKKVLNFKAIMFQEKGVEIGVKKYIKSWNWPNTNIKFSTYDISYQKTTFIHHDKKKEIQRQISIQRQIKGIEIRAEVIGRNPQERTRLFPEMSEAREHHGVPWKFKRRNVLPGERNVFLSVGIHGRPGVVSRARVKTDFCAASPLLVARTMKRTVGGRQALRRQIQFTHYQRVT